MTLQNYDYCISQHWFRPIQNLYILKKAACIKHIQEEKERVFRCIIRIV